MPITNAHHTDDRNEPMARIESAWQRIKTHLEGHRRQIADEIRKYPTPIPACDAQFNFLLDERQRVTQELRELEGARKQGLTGAEAIARIGALMRASGSISDELERSIRSFLEDAGDGVAPDAEMISRNLHA